MRCALRLWPEPCAADLDGVIAERLDARPGNGVASARRDS